MFSAPTEDELLLSGRALRDLMCDVLGKGMSFRFRAKGESMFPFILDGDVLVIVPKGAKMPSLGSVVAFSRPGADKLVVHRVVARHGAACLISGDRVGGGRNAGGRELVPLERIHGVVAVVERGGRRVRFGLGPERIVLALLSRFGLLLPVWQWTAPIHRVVKKGS